VASKICDLAQNPTPIPPLPIPPDPTHATHCYHHRSYTDTALHLTSFSKLSSCLPLQHPALMVASQSERGLTPIPTSQPTNLTDRLQSHSPSSTGHSHVPPRPGYILYIGRSVFSAVPVESFSRDVLADRVGLTTPVTTWPCSSNKSMHELLSIFLDPPYQILGSCFQSLCRWCSRRDCLNQIKILIGGAQRSLLPPQRLHSPSDQTTTFLGN